MTKEIRLKCGLVALVDDEDFDWLNRHHWLPAGRKRAYAERNVRSETINGKRKRHKQYMHREVMGLETGDPRFVDHINGNTWDNRKQNLRITNAAGNSQNARPLKTKTTCQYKGVTKVSGSLCYRANIRIDDKIVVLGCYKTAMEAALVYDHHARLRYGEMAWLNFPDQKPDVLPKPITRDSRGPKAGRRFKGIMFRGGNQWSASFNYKHIGIYPSEEDAARAFDWHARRSGKDVYLNFPDEDPELPPQTSKERRGKAA